MRLPVRSPSRNAPLFGNFSLFNTILVLVRSELLSHSRPTSSSTQRGGILCNRNGTLLPKITLCIPWRPYYLRTRLSPITLKVSECHVTYLQRFAFGRVADICCFLGEGGNEPATIPNQEHDASSNPPSPSYAPRGRPTVRSKFRHKLPPPLRLAIPQNSAVAIIHNTCSVSAHIIATSGLRLADLYAESC